MAFIRPYRVRLLPPGATEPQESDVYAVSAVQAVAGEVGYTHGVQYKTEQAQWLREAALGLAEPVDCYRGEDLASGRVAYLHATDLPDARTRLPGGWFVHGPVDEWLWLAQQNGPALLRLIAIAYSRFGVVQYRRIEELSTVAYRILGHGTSRWIEPTRVRLRHLLRLAMEVPYLAPRDFSSCAANMRRAGHVRGKRWRDIVSVHGARAPGEVLEACYLAGLGADHALFDDAQRVALDRLADAYGFDPEEMDDQDRCLLWLGNVAPVRHAEKRYRLPEPVRPDARAP